MRPFNKKPARDGGLASTAEGRLFRFLAGFHCVFPLPFDARLAEPEGVVVLDGVHVVRDVVIYQGLDFTDKGAMNSHFFSRNKPGLLHDTSVMDDGVEVVVKRGETLVGLRLAFKMVDSHFLSGIEGIWSGSRQHRECWRLPFPEFTR